MTRSHRTEPQGNPKRFLSGALLLTAVGSAAFAQSTMSQQNSAAAPAASEIAPRGQREVKDLTYSDWKKLCFKPGGAKMICRTSIAGTFPTGQMAVRVDVVEREGDATARVQVFCPVGMYLPKPATLAIDQGKPFNVPYTWCLTNACIAGAAADSKMIQEMNSGQTLRLEFVDSNLLSLTTSLPLGQFAAVHKGAPAQIFDQDIDE
ncbi:invasion associated locus B family protein [Bradyrhizobium sp. AUGA SZCCT0222]|uniref:invasion associated locus B family protein n=1 Tax=Bradyrhizobium sp. AUGA SZCCT0222 TaxID=2807668 RepID=UPI001BAD0E52|nr:invasion associated locus B family protein [Bradyrhizobium sp. AUGA SZCCT0222]MBR1268707.1 invasion associated locus B family protein [Bradyrhizobium sp. AUGA SZCCT0222]